MNNRKEVIRKATDKTVDIGGCILMHGDCLERMRQIAAGSVDLTLTDPPYRVTACGWDMVISFAPWWEGIHSAIKKNGAWGAGAQEWRLLNAAGVSLS